MGFFGASGGGGGGVAGVKRYKALVSQTGTAAPTVVVLENTLGGTVVWTRFAVGYYQGTLAGAFPDNKVLCTIGNTSNNSVLAVAPDTVDSLAIVQGNLTGAPLEGLFNESLVVEVYP